ncbi:hypothetical protein M011DRAFT_174483 [Sporormia fimetaria CBS 119925]|uniref:Uncharacterized protein n=1 Tax=Sporormia fimetaria CBS 119925 TaxID=1340428 RepID=A0A6A6VN40_9PLEO|nr:hypothetical protein M011DRAFT_174483 [Sporormia fimetaria CBS 119925]
MRPAIAVFLFSTATLVSAQEFWWSYPPENYTETHKYGYDPIFNKCGNSCEDCAEGAATCFASQAENICYEPKKGEQCCGDIYGSSCYPGYFCAYNDKNAAFCCADGTKTVDCGNLFNPVQILRDTLGDTSASAASESATRTSDGTTAAGPTDASATDASSTEASSDASATTTETPPPKGSNAPDLEGIEGFAEAKPKAKGGMSVGAKVGIAIGAVALVAIIAAAVFFLMRRRRAKKYGTVAPPPAGQYVPPGVETAYAPPAYAPGPQPSGFEPMRGQESEYYKPAMEQSPQPAAATPYKDGTGVSYPQVAEMAGKPVEVHEIGTSEAGRR